MPENNINLKIKTGPPIDGSENGVPVADRIALVDCNETKLGARPLEPEEIVSLPEKQARELLKSLPHHLEITEDKATRELYIMEDYKSTSRFYGNKKSQAIALAQQKEEQAKAKLNVTAMLQQQQEMLAEIEKLKANK